MVSNKCYTQTVHNALFWSVLTVRFSSIGGEVCRHCSPHRHTNAKRLFNQSATRNILCHVVNSQPPRSVEYAR